MFASRRKAQVRFGLASTAEYTRSPSTANTIGTTWGIPAPSAVASRAIRAAPNLRRASDPVKPL
jgi:hypothetical protein